MYHTKIFSNKHAYIHISILACMHGYMNTQSTINIKHANKNYQMQEAIEICNYNDILPACLFLFFIFCTRTLLCIIPRLRKIAFSLHFSKCPKSDWFPYIRSF